MKNVAILLGLALLAGGALANLAPMNSAEAVVTPVGPLGDLSQSLSCPAPDLGDCIQINFQPGDCDCDIPAVVGYCMDINGRYWEVTQCYGTIFCGLGANCQI